MTLIMACNEEERRKETPRQQIQIIPGTETTNKYMKKQGIWQLYFKYGGIWHRSTHSCRFP